MQTTKKATNAYLQLAKSTYLEMSSLMKLNFLIPNYFPTLSLPLNTSPHLP